MSFCLQRIGVFLAVILFFLPELNAETNLWPFFHQKEADSYGRIQDSSMVGPFLSERILENETIFSFRPLATKFKSDFAGESHFHLVYPLFNYYEKEAGHYWSMLQFLKGSRDDRAGVKTFDAFPFIFWKNSENDNLDYFAFWPLGGTLKGRFFRDRIDFALWPLFVRTERKDEIWTHTPYPFIQRLSGPKSSGFGLWPFYGSFSKEDSYKHTWALWPFFYHYRDKLNEEVPYVRTGLLPFYHRETGAGLKSESFIWPFFGYTKESDPRPQYDETRYFWPLVVQGRGEENYVNRLLPFYANERRPQYQKRWFLWPILKTENWELPGIEKTRNSLFYFIFQDEIQEFNNTYARKTFLWPISAYWNDGLGRKQFQLFDPLTVFFPRNEKIRENWTPLFALYRYDRRIDSSRHSLLWNLLVWENGPGKDAYFAAGPLFEYDRQGSTGHWEILKGLLGYEMGEGKGNFYFFWK